MGFNRRTLRRLERRGPRPCPQCGALSPHEPGRLVLRVDGTPAEGFPDDPEERCSRCDRALWCVVQIVYDEKGEGTIADA